MKAVLLAGGLGTRLRPLTERTPKCLVPICGRPLLDLWIDALLGAGFEQILLNTHHLAEQVHAHIAGHCARDRIILFHEPVLRGTAGTLESMAEMLGDSTFLCVHADNLARIDLPAFIRAHQGRPEQVAISLLTFDTDAPTACGIVEEDGSGMVVRFHEKVAHPPGRRANGAVYLMEPEVLRFIRALPGSMKDVSTQVLPAYLGRMQAWFDPNTYLIDIGTPAALQAGERAWARMMRPVPECVP